MFSKLRRVRDYVDVDAVVITHMHPDHFFDLVPYACALTYGAARPRRRGARGDDGPRAPAAARPAGATELLRTMTVAGGQPRLLDGAFDDRRVRRRAGRLAVGALELRFQPVPHYVPANAIERALREPAGASPSAPTTARPTRSTTSPRDTDLLFLEATLPAPEARRPARAPDGRRGRRARRPLPARGGSC